MKGEHFLPQPLLYRVSGMFVYIFFQGFGILPLVSRQRSKYANN